MTDLVVPARPDPLAAIRDRIVARSAAGATHAELADLFDVLQAAYADTLTAPDTFAGTTAGGLPYPDPTDPVANGANAIRSLAEAVGARYAKAFHKDAGGTTLPAGGGTLGYVGGLSIPAVPYLRWAVAIWRGMCTTQTASAVEFILTLNGSNIVYARSNGANSNPTGVYFWQIVANTAVTAAVNCSSSAGCSASADPRWSGLDVFALASV